MTSRIDPKDIDVHKLEFEAAAYDEFEVPFELSTKDFLDFASDDLKGQLMRDTVNALGNIKRSIDCLFDSLLFVESFLEDAKRERWTFPEKMNFLGEIGIITPYILGKINSARNLLEHEFKKPSRKDVETAYDVANLLYYATIRFTKNSANLLDLTTEDGKWGLEIKVNRNDKKITIGAKSQEFSVSWDESPEDYKRWLHVLYQAQYLCT